MRAFHQRAGVAASATCLAALLAAGPTAVDAAEVVLRLKGGNYQVSGDLKSFDGLRYMIDVKSLGMMMVDAARFDCHGKGCTEVVKSTPGERMASAAAPPASFAIQGSSTIGFELMPALIKGFAEQGGGSLVKRHGTDKKESEHRIVNRAGQETVTITLRVTGSKTAFTGLESGAAEIGMAGRPITSEEQTKLAPVVPDMRAAGNEHVVGLDAVAVIVAPENPINSLGYDAIAGIYSGRIKDWSEVGRTPGPINFYTPSQTSGRFEVFEDGVLKPRGLKLDGRAKEIVVGAELGAAVAADPNGIGVTSLALVGNAKSLNLELSCGLISSPSRFAVKAEEYPLARRLYLYTLGQPRQPVAQALLKYATSAAAQPKISEASFVDQSVDSLGFDEQTARNTYALNAAAPHFDMAQMRQLLADLAGSRRLSVTLRFSSGTAEVDAKGRQDLGRLIELMRTPEMKGKTLTIAGFTDSIGTIAQNNLVSLRRAQQVRAQLLALSGDKALQKLVIAKGYGPLSPVACNDSEDGQRLNRRVEFWVR